MRSGLKQPDCTARAERLVQTERDTAPERRGADLAPRLGGLRRLAAPRSRRRLRRAEEGAAAARRPEAGATLRRAEERATRRRNQGARRRIAVLRRTNLETFSDKQKLSEASLVAQADSRATQGSWDAESRGTAGIRRSRQPKGGAIGTSLWRWVPLSRARDQSPPIF